MTTITVNEWIDYLMQIGSINSYEDYAKHILDIGLDALAQELADQPESTPDNHDLYEWAKKINQ